MQPNLRMGVRSGAGQVSWQSGGRLRPEREAGHSSVSGLKVLPAVWALRGACCVVRMRGWLRAQRARLNRAVRGARTATQLATREKSILCYM